VVLLHGIQRTPRSMRKLAKALAREGFTVVNVGYPSTKHPMETLAGTVLRDAVASRCPDPARAIHFVTHSLGGILVRLYLKEHRPPNLGRVVMLAPPNRGSAVAERLRSNWVYRKAYGPAGQQLGTGPESVPRSLGPVDFDAGVIAGNKAWHPAFAKWLPGESDGTVAVESARVEGMRDFLVVPHGHTFIMRSDAVIAQTLHYLRHGCFRHDEEAEE
jgi:pimeloyl-ACP methyl ester carboxylesterase